MKENHFFSPFLDQCFSIQIIIMPTVLRKNGFDFLIYTNDHLPGHVHIFKAGKETIIDLGTADKAPTIREIVGMNRKDVVKALQLVFEYQDYLLAKWKEIHGHD